MSAAHTIGNYLLGPLLGRGGMSEIHAGEHRFLGDQVAIKLLRSHVARAPGAADAFLTEATRTRAIEHPNVVRVLDFGIDGDDCYLVMERLDGESLAERLVRTGKLDEAELRSLGAAIADGLAAAHDLGIIHRDLKPANVMLARGGPKIVDFRIARQLASDGATTTGSQIGTLAYMAPEQLAGGLVAPCVDVWALGVLLFEACTGQLPFADFADGRAPQLVDAAPRLATRALVSAAFDALVASCLERDPRDRPASMREIAAALRAAPAEERFTEDLPPMILPPVIHVPVIHAPVVPAPVIHEPTARRRLSTVIIALSAFAVIAIGATAILRTTPPDTASAPPPAPVAVAAPSPSPVTIATTPPLVAAPSPPPVAITTPPPVAVVTTPPVAIAPPPPPPPAPAPATTSIVVRSTPAGADVLLAGKRVGVTPATLDVALPAALTVTHAGYQPARLTAEHAGPITVRLVRAPRHPPPSKAGETLD